VAREGLSDHVQFLGEIDDERMVQCYQQCDLFVLPNREVDRDIEGFGIVLLEAQACGKPVVAGTSGGTAETMQIPETGLVIPCEGPEVLASTVIELLADPVRRARMGEAARTWVVRHFDWSSLSCQAEALFEAGSSNRDRELLTAQRILSNINKNRQLGSPEPATNICNEYQVSGQVCETSQGMLRAVDPSDLGPHGFSSEARY
jgi:glycosyltransferase involved in cell wall biosynthesis